MLSRLNRRTGFSLVELMVAIAILVIAIFGTLAALGISADLRATSSEMEVAHQEVQRHLAKLRSERLLLNVVNGIYLDPDGGGPLSAHEFAIDASNKLRNARGRVFVLSESQVKSSFQVDTNKDGALSAADLWDLDQDTVFDEGPTATFDPDNAATHVSQVEAAGFNLMVPVRIIIEWDPLTARGDATRRRRLVFDSLIYPPAL